MRALRRGVAACLLVVTMAAVGGSATAAPTFYCGFSLDRVCRIICPKCAAVTPSSESLTSR